MKQRTRIYYTQEQRELMWDRWKKGDSLHTIGRLFDRGHSSIAGILSETGGIRPPKRKRSRLSLTLAEREEISRGLVTQLSIRAISSHLKRSPSTVCREINRNGGYHDTEQHRLNKPLGKEQDVLSVANSLTIKA